MSTFQGTSFDIYIHWLILSLGIGVLMSGIAVLSSCRIIAGHFHLLKPNTEGSQGFYHKFYKHHSIYWAVFWYMLPLHLLVAAIHVGLPAPIKPYYLAHQGVFITSLSNFALVLIVLTSCRSIVSALNFFMSKSPLRNNVYKQYYKLHSFFWWVLALSISGHIVFGLIHAINT